MNTSFYIAPRQLDLKRIKSEEELERLAQNARYWPQPVSSSTIRKEDRFSIPVHGRRLVCDPRGPIANLFQAIRLLKMGIKNGLIDSQKDKDGWPEYAWAVKAATVYEAKRLFRNGTKCYYHAYQLPSTDPFIPLVLEAWSIVNE